MLISSLARAAALGDELILSQLGDPVEVEISIAQWEDIDLEQVQVTAGTPEVYESFGLDYLPAIESLNFNVIGPNLNGEVKILVSSREPMQEPYLQLLLVMRWPGGSLLREYVLLFDPPRATPAPSSASITPPVSSSVPPPAIVPQPEVVTAPEIAPDVTAANQSPPNPAPPEVAQPPQEQEIEAPVPQPLAQETVTVREIDEPVPVSEVDGAVTVVEVEEDIPVPDAPTAPAPESGTYTVENGDNLWNIASRFGPPNADVYQILLGIYELNRGSFINGNISLLKYGAALRLPTTADIAGIDPVTAKSLFDQRWEEGSERIELAERGEPLPPFSSIFSPDVVRPEFNPTAPVTDSQNDFSQEENVGGGPAVATVGPQAPGLTGASIPGQNAGPGVANVPGQPPVSNAGRPALPVMSIAPAVNSGGVPLPQAGTPAAPANSAVAVNPYLDGVNTTMQLMKEMLEARQQQVELLEAQMSEMNARMLEITRITERLNSSLDEALAQRQRQQESDWRSTLLLGGLVLVLSIAVIVIMMMALKLAAQIRVQHDLLQSAIQNRSMAAATGRVPVARTEPAKSVSEPVKARNVRKPMVPEHALGVSIIEDEDTSEPSLPDTAHRETVAGTSKEEMNVQLGDMELDQADDSGRKSDNPTQ